MKKKNLIFIALYFLAGCATQTITDSYNPPSFLDGLWHGFTIAFSLIWHLFDNSVRIYSFPNSGGWYDLGYFIGTASWFRLFDEKCKTTKTNSE